MRMPIFPADSNLDRRNLTISVQADGAGSLERGEPLRREDIDYFRMWSVKNGVYHEEILGGITAFGSPSISTAGPTSGAAATISTNVGDLVMLVTWSKGGAGVPTHTIQSNYTELFSQAHDDGSTDGRLSVAIYDPNSDGLGGDLSGSNAYTAYAVSGGTSLITYTQAIVLAAGTFNMGRTEYTGASTANGATAPALPTLTEPEHGFYAFHFAGLHTNGAQDIEPSPTGTGWEELDGLFGSFDTELYTSVKLGNGADGVGDTIGANALSSFGTLNGSCSIGVMIQRTPPLVAVSNDFAPGLFRMFMMSRWAGVKGTHTFIVETAGTGPEDMIRREFNIDVEAEDIIVSSTVAGAISSTSLSSGAKIGIADAVLDEPMANHLDADSVGEAISEGGGGTEPLDAGETAAAVWSAARASYNTAGTFGEGVRLMDAAITAAKFAANAIATAALATSAKEAIRDTILDTVLDTGRTIRGWFRRKYAHDFGRVTGQRSSTVTAYKSDGTTPEFQVNQDINTGTRDPAGSE